MALPLVPLFAALADAADNAASTQTAPAGESAPMDPASMLAPGLLVPQLIVGTLALIGLIWLLRRLKVPAGAPRIHPKRPYLFNTMLRREKAKPGADGKPSGQPPADGTPVTVPEGERPLVPADDNPEDMAQFGVLEFALAFFSQFVFVGFIARLLYPDHQGPFSPLEALQISMATSLLVAVALVIFTTALHNQNPLAYLVPRGTWSGMWWKAPALTALGWAAVALLATPLWVLVLTAVGEVRDQQQSVTWLLEARHQMSGGQLTMVVLAVVVVAPVYEELMFRGFLYIGIRKLAGPVFATLVSAAAFALMHDSLYAQGSLFALGIVLSATFERTRNLAVPIIFHAVFNSITLLLIFSGAFG